jgi:D-arabinose 1-dehydrogenase-like Zn-dependent alcohol dehydrogenase
MRAAVDSGCYDVIQVAYNYLQKNRTEIKKAIQYANNVLGMSVATTVSKSKFKFVHQLGADVVIDYNSEDFTRIVNNHDAVLDSTSFLYKDHTLHRGSAVLNKKDHY